MIQKGYWKSLSVQLLSTDRFYLRNLCTQHSRLHPSRDVSRAIFNTSRVSYTIRQDMNRKSAQKMLRRMY